MRTRRQYVRLNWDILGIRSALEFVFVFTPYRHVPLDRLTAALPWHLPFNIPQDSLAFCILLGYLSSSMMDSAAMQEKLFGFPIPGWVKETIPQIPAVQQLVQNLTTKTVAGEPADRD